MTIWLTTQIRRLSPVAPRGRLLVQVLNPLAPTPAFPVAGVRTSSRSYLDDDAFSDMPGKKGKNILRVGFLNIGGLPLERNKIKHDLIRRGITAFDFDAFGMAEINTD